MLVYYTIKQYDFYIHIMIMIIKDSFLDQVATLADFEAISKEVAKIAMHACTCNDDISQLDSTGSQSAVDSQKILMRLLHKHRFSSKTVIPLHNPKYK